MSLYIKREYFQLHIKYKMIFKGLTLIVKVTSSDSFYLKSDFQKLDKYINFL